MWTENDERELTKLLDRKAKYYEEREQFLAIINKARDAIVAGKVHSITSDTDVYLDSSYRITTIEVKFYE